MSFFLCGAAFRTAIKSVCSFACGVNRTCLFLFFVVARVSE